MIQKVQRHEETQQAKVRRKMGILHGRKGEGDIDVRKTRKNEIENRDFTAEEVSERVLIFHKDEHLSLLTVLPRLQSCYTRKETFQLN